MILIVDDNVDVLDGLRTLVEEQGFQVITTTCAREAVRIAQEQNITSVLSDVTMSPTGYWLAKQMKKKSPNTSVALLSGDPVLLSSLKAPDVDAFFVKGTDMLGMMIAWMKLNRHNAKMN